MKKNKQLFENVKFALLLLLLSFIVSVGNGCSHARLGGMFAFTLTIFFLSVLIAPL